MNILIKPMVPCSDDDAPQYLWPLNDDTCHLVHVLLPRQMADPTEHGLLPANEIFDAISRVQGTLASDQPTVVVQAFGATLEVANPVRLSDNAKHQLGEAGTVLRWAAENRVGVAWGRSELRSPP